MKSTDSRVATAIDETSVLDYSALVVIGAILALALLTGCTTVSLGGASDPDQYNPVTGYPAVGGAQWHL